MKATKYAILAHDAFGTRTAKMAHGVMTFAPERVVAVIDRAQAGKSAGNVPIVADLREALRFGPNALLVGIAPQGGKLPKDYRAEIVAALENGLDVHSGLHDFLREDVEFRSLAQRHRRTLVELREPPTVPLFSGKAYEVAIPILLTVGSDCAVGKMTASLELVRAARERGTQAVFVPTGQIGRAIAGWGIAVDRVIADFAPGAAERLVLEGASRDGAQLLVVEGQGGINHPAYAPVTLALLTGSAPDALLLVHEAGRTRIEGYGTPILSLRALIATYEHLCAGIKPARVVGVALNTRSLDAAAARAAIEDARQQTNLPVDDVVRFGPHALYDAIAPRIEKRAPLQ